MSTYSMCGAAHADNHCTSVCVWWCGGGCAHSTSAVYCRLYCADVLTPCNAVRMQQTRDS